MFGNRGKYEAESSASAAQYKKKARKSNLLSAYFTSLLSLILCATMFLSTSMAWFTSEVNNTGNEILVGTLDVTLEHANGTTNVEGNEVVNWVNLEQADQDYRILPTNLRWQPGTFTVERFLITNSGNLGLTYRMLLDWKETSTDEAVIAKNLEAAQNIEVWATTLDMGNAYVEPTSYEALIGQYENKDDDTKNGGTNWFLLGTLDELLKGETIYAGQLTQGHEKGEFAIALHMQADAGKGCMGAELLGITVRLIATQMTDNGSGNVLYIPKNQTVELTGEVEPLAVYGEGTLVLKDVTIQGNSNRPSALTIAGDLTVDVKGETKLTGAAGGSGICVNEGVTLTLTGPMKDGTMVVDENDPNAVSSLTVIGNNGIEYEPSGNYTETPNETGYENKGGSGIYVADGASLVINGVYGLTAEGYGVNGFGIGGPKASVTIQHSQIIFVRGGFVNVTGKYVDSKYTKEEPNGGAAIGGTKIAIEKTHIVEALGGSKSAGIGAQFWQPTNISISKSNIDKVVGGVSAAGIGGSRIMKGVMVDKDNDTKADKLNGYELFDNHEQTVFISITDSNVTAIGGYFGAGIGSGYDTYCHFVGLGYGPICTINISGETEINATGGKYAAGVGTGYHAGGLDGEIETSVKITATSGEKNYKDAYTLAQDIGFGVLDPNRDAYSNTCSILYNEVENLIPTVESATPEESSTEVTESTETGMESETTDPSTEPTT